MAHILLIDDDPDFRAVMRELLWSMGHTVSAARDGREGLELFSRAASDLVITDILMPEVDGLEVILELRRRAPGVKVIAVSGGLRLTAAELLRAARRMGAARVLEKPFGRDALMQAVDHALAALPERAVAVAAR
jgi:CheY-like chemotaxis protein